jgi:hypothetical protein
VWWPLPTLTVTVSTVTVTTSTINYFQQVGIYDHSVLFVWSNQGRREAWHVARMRDDKFIEEARYYYEDIGLDGKIILK